ncbi:PREDICTED: nudC domain-containing protein 3-like [Ceratosolen solmsi marchali]|uniref:NudC domain-containing protein 3-like n=1 Tax=Ceratosolen solmsi marchali TaxID=326594 RepID=A0AAJ6VIR5_9HYME|nr:PREDICTED: nudC domain-containing protein 3-like [Ceratosolen solmsi marchali]
MSTTNVENAKNSKSDFTNDNSENTNVVEEPWTKDTNTSDYYNGASCKSYSWSQSIVDLDVLVPVPWEVRNSKQLRVVLDSHEIEVTKLGVNDSLTLVKGRLSFKTKSGESYWYLDPGKHLTLHLEKANERWWESLLEDEPLIELSRIDCTRKFEEMSECEQMKVEELMWKQRRKSFAQPTYERLVRSRIMAPADTSGSSLVFSHDFPFL